MAERAERQYAAEQAKKRGEIARKAAPVTRSGYGQKPEAPVVGKPPEIQYFEYGLSGKDLKLGVPTASGSEKYVYRAFVKNYKGTKKEHTVLGNKENLPWGTPGASRLDVHITELNLTIEVKRYNVQKPSGRAALVSKVVQQANERAAPGQLPKGLKQGLAIDVRGQKLTDAQAIDLIQRISKGTKGAIPDSRIWIIFDK